MKFQEFALCKEILKAIDKVGYTEPSPIQEQAIPVVLAKRDMVGCAQTGTGKTAAFAIPTLQLLSMQPRQNRRVIKTLILTPTRELAIQIHENFQQYGRYLPIKTTVIFGGVGQAPQVDQLKRGVDILIATPGRLGDLHGQGHIDLSQVETFILDEADRMLDMGFVHDVKRVIALLPTKRQTLLFSATMPPEIKNLVATILHDPAYIQVTPVSSTAQTVSQLIYHVDKPNKTKLLLHLLEDPALTQLLVFTRTKHGADRVARDLVRQDVQAMAIHGNKSQSARQRALACFKSGEIRVLIATDIAARGIDINQLPMVINFDLPNIPETYVHRIGRTGRAGIEGASISFCCYDEVEYLRDIEKLIGKAVPVQNDHPYPMKNFELTPPAKPQPRRGGQGSSKKSANPASRNGKSTRGETGRGGKPAHKSRTGKSSGRNRFAKAKPKQ